MSDSRIRGYQISQVRLICHKRECVYPEHSTDFKKPSPTYLFLCLSRRSPGYCPECGKYAPCSPTRIAWQRGGWEHWVTGDLQPQGGAIRAEGARKLEQSVRSSSRGRFYHRTDRSNASFGFSDLPVLVVPVSAILSFRKWLLISPQINSWETAAL